MEKPRRFYVHVSAGSHYRVSYSRKGVTTASGFYPMDFTLLLRAFGAKNIRWNKAGTRVTFEKPPEADFVPLMGVFDFFRWLSIYEVYED